MVAVDRKVGARGVEPRTGVFYLNGKVQPTYAGKPVNLMRKKCASCSWKQIATQRTTKPSRYSFRLPNPRSGSHYSRVKVPAGGGFLKSGSDTWEIWRIL